MENRISDIDPHLSIQELKNYLAGKFPNRDMNRIEKHLSSCPLCSDALTGLEEIDPSIVEKDLVELGKILESRTLGKRRRNTLITRIAASLIVISMSTYLIYQYSMREDQLDQSLPLVQMDEEIAAEEIQPDTLMVEADEAITSTESIAQPILEASKADNNASAGRLSIAAIDSNKLAIADDGEVLEEQIDEGAGEATRLEITEIGIDPQPEAIEPIDAQDKAVTNTLETQPKKSVSINAERQALSRAPTEENVNEQNLISIQPISMEGIITPARPSIEESMYKKAILSALMYPDEAAQNGITGDVELAFKVDSIGQLTDFQILKSLGFGCDEEAIRAIKNGPDWIPAKDTTNSIPQTIQASIPFHPKN